MPLLKYLLIVSPRVKMKAEKYRIIRAYIRAGTWRGAAKLLNVSEKTLIQLRKKHHINPHGEIEA